MKYYGNDYRKERCVQKNWND